MQCTKRFVVAFVLGLAVLISSWNVGVDAGQGQAPAPAGAAAPRFQVDSTWPLEMPKNWILGAVTGVFVDAKDHIWVTHLPETLTEEETAAVQKPPIARAARRRPR